jgi:hypothetical protein
MNIFSSRMKKIVWIVYEFDDGVRPDCLPGEPGLFFLAYDYQSRCWLPEDSGTFFQPTSAAVYTIASAAVPTLSSQSTYCDLPRVFRWRQSLEEGSSRAFHTRERQPAARGTQDLRALPCASWLGATLAGRTSLNRVESRLFLPAINNHLKTFILVSIWLGGSDDTPVSFGIRGGTNASFSRENGRVCYRIHSYVAASSLVHFHQSTARN